MGDTESLKQEDQNLVQRVTTDAVDITKFSPEEKQQIDEIKGQIDLGDSQAVIIYGVGAQKEISNFSDNILNQVRAKDTGHVGSLLTDLVINIKDLKVDNLSSGGSFLSNIPIIGDMVNSAKKFVGQYEKMSVKIENIVEELDKARMTLLKDITLLDNLYEKNIDYLKKLDLYIAAGQLKLKEVQEKMLPELKAKAESSKDAIEAQKYQDIVQAANRFEKKLHDLKLSRIVSIQTGPQIRLIQNGDQTLVEKIQSSIINTIPLWKNQIVIAISLFRQDKALKLQKEVSETTNELLQKNAELLKQGTVEVAKESEKGIVEIETLKKVNSELISTLEETIKIQQEGRNKRQAAEGELVKIEKDLKDKLTSMQG